VVDGDDGKSARPQCLRDVTIAVDAVRQAMIGQKVKSPSGFEVTMGPNHHMAKPVMIGEIQANGQFSIVYKSKALPPNAWSPTSRRTRVRSQTGRGHGVWRLHDAKIREQLD